MQITKLFLKMKYYQLILDLTCSKTVILYGYIAKWMLSKCKMLRNMSSLIEDTQVILTNSTLCLWPLFKKKNRHSRRIIEHCQTLPWTHLSISFLHADISSIVQTTTTIKIIFPSTKLALFYNSLPWEKLFPLQKYCFQSKVDKTLTSLYRTKALQLLRLQRTKWNLTTVIILIPNQTFIYKNKCWKWVALKMILIF